MRWTVAEVENVIHSSDADVFTGNTQHGFLCPSCVVNRLRKDRAAAPPHFYVLVRHCHRRLDIAPIVRPFPFPGTQGKAQMLAVVFFFRTPSLPSAVEKTVPILWKTEYSVNALFLCRISGCRIAIWDH